MRCLTALPCRPPVPDPCISEASTVTDVPGKNGGTPLLKLKPWKYDIVAGFHRSLLKAINGIENLPNEPDSKNLPADLVYYYAPLVEQVGDLLGAVLIQVKKDTQAGLNNDDFTKFSDQFE